MSSHAVDRGVISLIFIALENSVCPSVTRVNCDKTVERSVQIYIPYEKSFSLVF